MRARINLEADRTVRRAVNGLRYLADRSPAVVGATPREVVWQRDKARLYRYTGGMVRFSPPIVLVYSLVCRSYIMDLRPGNSMVEFLMRSGFDVFMLDWGVPDELDAENTLETYCDEYLPRAVDAACRAAGSENVTLVGYCLGGVLTLLFVAGHVEAPVRNFVTLATPVDFRQMGAMVALIRKGRLESEDLLDDTGNVPPDLLHKGFKMLAPTDQLVQYVNLWQNLWNDEFVAAYAAMAQWARDHVPFPGATLRQLAELGVRQNRLMTGSFPLGDREVRLSDVRCRVLNVMAEQDTVVPLDSSRPLRTLIGRRRVRELRLPAGHIASVAGSEAQRRTLPRLAEWLAMNSLDVDDTAVESPGPTGAVPAVGPQTATVT
jgi:polyhydroxyalkanoate synthase subunit PhaC